MVADFLPGRHVRGISPDGSKVYMDDNTVISTSTDQVIGKLPFSQPIPPNGFSESPLGDYLYSQNEVVQVTTNTLVSTKLPFYIFTGSAYSGDVPGGPAISPDGSQIFAGAYPIENINTADLTSKSTGISVGSDFLSDIAVSPDGKRLLTSTYAYAAGELNIYDAKSFQPVGAVPNVGDFAGQIGFLGSDLAVVGSGGNPVFQGGGLTLVDLATKQFVQHVSIPGAAVLTASPQAREVFVSEGASGPLTAGQPEIAVYSLGADGILRPSTTYSLANNPMIALDGASFEIRKLVFKPLTNRRPVLDPIGDKSITAGEQLSFVASATHQGGGPLVWGLVNDPPAGAAIDRATGRFTWTPTKAQSPSTYSITVYVADGMLFDAETFKVTVAAALVVPERITVVGGRARRAVDQKIRVTFSGPLMSIGPDAFVLLKQQRHQSHTIRLSVRTSKTGPDGQTVSVLQTAGRRWPLTDGMYILTIQGDQIRDVLGRPLDGNQDGIPGGIGFESFRIVRGRLKR
jgi:hypothetical protein